MKIINKNNRCLSLFYILIAMSISLFSSGLYAEFSVIEKAKTQNPNVRNPSPKTAALKREKATQQEKISSTLNIRISASSNKVTAGDPLTFKARVSHSNAKLTWRLDRSTSDEKSSTFTVNTHKLSVGIHTVTLEANLTQQELRPQRKTVSKTFTVVAKKGQLQPSIKAPVVIPPKTPPEIKPPTTNKAPKPQKPSTPIKNDDPEKKPVKLTKPRPTVKAEPQKKPRKTNEPVKTIPTSSSPSPDQKPKSSPVESTETAEPTAPNQPNNKPSANDIGALQANTVPNPEPLNVPTLENKHYGEIKYNPLKKMTLNKAERVEVGVGWNSVDSTGFIGKGEVQEEAIPVTASMTVHLCCGDSNKGDAFDIKPLNSATQIIERTKHTQWAFDVIPRKSGEHYLNLSVSSHYIDADGKSGTKDIPVITRTIKVDVDRVAETKSWLISNWKWLGSFIIAPLLAYFFFIKNRQKKSHRKFDKDIKIFISYRRNDSSGYSLALYKEINPIFGDENVFMDLDDIPHGSDFVEQIEGFLSTSHTVLVMIGKSWLNAHNEKGRRLDDPNDFVRLEIATALKYKLRVIPVLLKGAQMPSADDLPDILKPLARRNAIQLHDDQFEASMKKLIETLAHSN